MREPKCKTIDLETYPRKDHFLYFKDFSYPYVGMVVNIDITHFLKVVKDKKLPFFLSFLYFVVNAANSIPELKRRIDKDQIIEYDNCLSSHTVLKDDETFCYCTLDCTKPFDEYIKEAYDLNETAKKKGSIHDDANLLTTYFISCVPWISYTSLLQPTPYPADSNPRFNWGKYFTSEGKILIPVSIQANHALVDGLHISAFYLKLQKELDNFQ